MRRSAILCTVLLIYQMGACACGCLNENLWYQSFCSTLGADPLHDESDPCHDHNCPHEAVVIPLHHVCEHYDCDHCANQDFLIKRPWLGFVQTADELVVAVESLDQTVLRDLSRSRFSDAIFSAMVPRGPERAVLGVYLL